MANSYDAIVIGGGIIGCSVAWRLAQTGRRVALLERGHVGGEASSAAGGIFCPKASPDTPDDLFRFWSTSHDLCPAFVDEVKAVTGHAFELRVARQLAVGFTDQDVAQLAASFPLQAASGIRAQWLTAPRRWSPSPPWRRTSRRRSTIPITFWSTTRA